MGPIGPDPPADREADRFVGGPWQREFDKYRGMKGRNG